MLIRTIAEQPETGRALISLDIPPLITPAIYEAWQNYPEQARAGIIDRLPWGGLYIRFSDLQHLKAAGTCGSDMIRISLKYLDGELVEDRRAKMVHTIQHELTHFYHGHPLIDEPNVKHELECRATMINWGLDRTEDHKYLYLIGNILSGLEKYQDIPEILAIYTEFLRDEARDLFTDRERSFLYLAALVGIDGDYYADMIRKLFQAGTEITE